VAKAATLGIFYLESSFHKRWVVKFSDPDLIQQLNAVLGRRNQKVAIKTHWSATFVCISSRGTSSPGKPERNLLRANWLLIKIVGVKNQRLAFCGEDSYQGLFCFPVSPTSNTSVAHKSRAPMRSRMSLPHFAKDILAAAQWHSCGV